MKKDRIGPAALRPRSPTVWPGLMLLALSGVLLFLLFHYSNIDQVSIAPFYDPQNQNFPLRHAVLWEIWMHNHLRKILWFFPLAVVLHLVYLKCLQPAQYVQVRARLMWLLVMILLPPLFVSILKSSTTPACPWDLLQYGGSKAAQAFALVLPAASGKCFPAGHASGGFALFAFYYYYKDRSDTAQWFKMGLLLAALILGGLMGYAQMVRGAHFLSHTVATLWLTLLVTHILYYSKRHYFIR